MTSLHAGTEYDLFLRPARNETKPYSPLFLRQNNHHRIICRPLRPYIVNSISQRQLTRGHVIKFPS